MAARRPFIPSPLMAETSMARDPFLLPFNAVEARALFLGQKIDLVPNLDQAMTVIRVDAEIIQNAHHISRLRLGVIGRHVAYMQDHIGLDHILQRGAESGDEHGRQFGDEADCVGQDHLEPAWRGDRPRGRIERGEQHVLRQHVGPCEPVEQAGLSGVGVTNQRNRRIRHAFTPGPMQGACG